jgi:hypothetical protein
MFTKVIAVIVILFFFSFLSVWMKLVYEITLKFIDHWYYFPMILILFAYGILSGANSILFLLKSLEQKK